MEQTCNGNPFCNSLPPEVRDFLCDNAKMIYHKPKEIRSADHNSNQLEIISDGVLLLFTLMENGTREGIQLLKKGEVLGVHLLFERLTFPAYDTMALTEVRTCTFPIKLIETLFYENRQFAQALMQNLSKKHSSNITYWVNLHSKSGIEKVEYIYRMLENLEVDLSLITQEDLALIAGVSRITVARAMRNIYKSLL